MTKDEAIDLAIDSMWTTLGTWMESLAYESVREKVEDAVRILEGLRDHPYLDVEKYYKEEADNNE